MSAASDVSNLFDYDDMVEESSVSKPSVQVIETEGASLLDTEGNSVYTKSLITINGWPEVKTDFELRCIKILGKRMCTKVPTAYHRTSKLEVIAAVSYPSGDTLKHQIEDCLTGSAVAAAVTGAVTGQFEAAGAALLAFLKACLLAKGAKDVGSIDVGVSTRKTAGDWH